MNTETANERVRYVKKSQGLLDQARRVFGDELVTGAWFTSGFKNYALYHALEFNDDGAKEIDIAGLQILLEFCNGRQVIFYASDEYGGVFDESGNLEEL
jgi:hypothetical protein